MTGNGWKSSSKLAAIGRPTPSISRASETARVILLSFILSVIFQFPLAALIDHYKADPSFFSGSAEQKPLVPAESATPFLLFNQEESGGSRAVQQQAFQPTSIPHYAFIKFSSYRISLTTFYVVGITSKVVRDWDKQQVVHTCEWHSASKNGSLAENPVVANASMLYVTFDENGMTYVPAVVNCTFGDAVGGDGYGGSLIIRVSLTYHRWEKNVPAVVHEELPGDVESFLTPPKEKPHKYAFCGPPMHGHVKMDWIKSWLVYHNYLWNGDALFFFYNVGGVRDDERHHVQDFVDAGLLTITELTSPLIQTLFPSWYYHQLLYLNDCLQRAQFLADFVFFFDFDEFLQIRGALTLETLLNEHKDLPWLTVGSIPADFGHCTKSTAEEQGQQYAVERMLWHDQRPECTHDDQDPWLCIAHIGRRKWVANTKLTSLGGVHRAALPEGGGLHMNASTARVLHFHGVLNPFNSLCGAVVDDDDRSLLGNLERDEGLRRAFAKAKMFHIQRKEH